MTEGEPRTEPPQVPQPEPEPPPIHSEEAPNTAPQPKSPPESTSSPSGQPPPPQEESVSPQSEPPQAAPTDESASSSSAEPPPPPDKPKEISLSSNVTPNKNYLMPDEKVMETPEGMDVGIVGFNRVAIKGHEYKGKQKDGLKENVRLFGQWCDQASMESDDPIEGSLGDRDAPDALKLKMVKGTDGAVTFSYAKADDRIGSNDVVQPVRVMGQEGEFFICEVYSGTLSSPIKIPKSMILNAQLISLHHGIVQEITAGKDPKIFTPEEMKIIGAYVSALQGDTQPSKDICSSPEGKEILKNMTEGSAAISSDSLRGFGKLKREAIQNALKKARDLDPTIPSTHYDADIAEIDAMLKLVDGHIIADPRVISELARKVLHMELNGEKSKREQLLLSMKSEAGTIGGHVDPDELKNLEYVVDQLTQLETAFNKEGFEKNNIILGFFQGAQSGTYSEHDVGAVNAALSTGNTKPLIEALEKRKLYLTTQEREDARNFLEKNGKSLTIGGLIFALFLMKKASESGKGGPPQG